VSYVPSMCSCNSTALLRSIDASRFRMVGVEHPY
jgi:hypothetical protein